MSSVADYNVKITGNSSSAVQALVNTAIEGKRAAAELKAAAKAVTVEQEHTQKSTKNLTFAFQQLALGIQDGASVMGTGGFAGALRASGNNFIQMASMISATHGTVTAFAMTGLQLLVDNMKDVAKETKKASEELQHFKLAGDAIKDAAQEKERLQAIRDIEGVKPAWDREQKAEREVAEQQEIIDKAAKKREELSRQEGLIKQRAKDRYVQEKMQIDFLPNLTEEENRRFHSEEFMTLQDERGPFMQALGARSKYTGTEIDELKLLKEQLENVDKTLKESRETLRQRQNEYDVAMEVSLREERKDREENLKKLKEKQEKEDAKQLAKDEKEMEKARKGLDREWNKMQRMVEKDREKEQKAMEREEAKEQKRLESIAKREDEKERRRRAKHDPLGVGTKSDMSEDELLSKGAYEALARARAAPTVFHDLDEQVAKNTEKTVEKLDKIEQNTRNRAKNVLKHFPTGA